MSAATIIGLVMLFLFHILLDKFLIQKHYGIKDKPRGIYFKGRKWYFLMIEITICILFIVNGFIIFKYHGYSSPLLLLINLTLFFMLIPLVRGIEELIFAKSEKLFYHRWFSAAIYLIAFLIILIGEY